ncbi:hypothetical protein LTS18_010157 [Coniosporium uncinatum]|uniref:Uncharacterized protein n=1 Tax=Coniosporium uncinatum TaxID=93489 RepID=A0ACC3D9Q5_9PEZI|nr:hypothetical protein LTS18_010157 [Coniosporium uncinatum]
MGWFSILPDNLSSFETFIARVFIFLGLLTIGPWILVILYDFVLYSWRSMTYEVPYIGGRARGKQRPRAPSLAERPDGQPRRMSMVGVRPPSALRSDSDAGPASASGVQGEADSMHKRGQSETIFENG